MAEFKRQSAIGSIANPAASEAQATMALADTMQSFGRFGMERYARHRVESAQEEAQAVEPGTGAPEQRSSQTMTGRAYNEIVMAGHVASIKNDYTKRINELSVEHEADPIGFQKNAEAYKSGLLSGVSPEVRNQVSLDFDAAMIRPSSQIKQNHEKITTAESINGIVQSVDIISDDIARAAREGDLETLSYNTQAVEEIVETLNELGRSDIALKIQSSVDERIDKQLALGQAQKAIEAGVGASYIESFMKNPPDDLSPEQVDSYAATMYSMNKRQKALDAQQRAGVSIATSREISNLKIAASTGIGDPIEIQEKTEEFFDRGLITGAERTSIFTKLINAENKKIDTAKTQVDISNKLAGDDWIVVDGKDQDDYYKEVYMPQLAQVDPLTAEAMNVDFVNKMKRVPSALKAQLQTYVMSENPDLVMSAASMVDKINQIPGVVDNVFNTQQEAFMENMVQLSENLAPAEAFKLAKENTDPANKARVEARETQIKEQKKGSLTSKLDYRSEVESMFNPWWGGTDVDDVTGDQIAKEYGNLYEEYFKAGMSESGAKDKATKTIKRNWSEWNGQVIKYSPDDYYQVAGSSEYVVDQLAKDLNKEFMFEESVNKDSIVLISTEDTARSATTGNPIYRVGIKRGDSLEIIYGLNWKPDVDKERLRVEDENKALIDEAKEEERKHQELEQLLMERH